MDKYEITRIYSEKVEVVVDLIAQEVPLSIRVNDDELVTLLASPDHCIELAVGLLYSSGFISSFSDIEEIDVDKQGTIVSICLKNRQLRKDVEYRALLTSGCGRGTLFLQAGEISRRSKIKSEIVLHRNRIFELMVDFQSRSTGYKQTGGIHSAALASSSGIHCVYEDIGRHNAIDKILGYVVMHEIDVQDKFILTSGRISSEIVLKLNRTDLGLIVSRSAPTNQAINYARGTGISLIGFVRGRRMNVYYLNEQVCQIL
ncbi:MAG: formate dehydrogenase accessory sulfurtransferase FdhD [Methanosarcinaceae archaeon]|nr:formate dehydrogenase accessory sulfurtransferase FdhD [Methanosarcinaceae archaeon]